MEVYQFVNQITTAYQIIKLDISQGLASLLIYIGAKSSIELVAALDCLPKKATGDVVDRGGL